MKAPIFHGYNERTAAGYVPDARTATRIAEAVWIPIYGREKSDYSDRFTPNSAVACGWYMVRFTSRDWGG